MTDKEKTNKLYALLLEAEQLAAAFSGGYSNSFLSAEEFSAALSHSIKIFRLGDLKEINRLWFYFAPTSAWDDFIGGDGQYLANEIFPMLCNLKKT